MKRKRKAVPGYSRAKNRLSEMFPKYYNAFARNLFRSGRSEGCTRQGIVIFVPFSPLMRITELLLAVLLAFSAALFAQTPAMDAASGAGEYPVLSASEAVAEKIAAAGTEKEISKEIL